MLVSSAVIERLVSQGLGDRREIVGDHTPADLAFHPVVAMIPTTLKAIAAFESIDASLYARPSVSPVLEPTLRFIRADDVTPDIGITTCLTPRC
jgi:hypothetical protein